MNTADTRIAINDSFTFSNYLNHLINLTSNNQTTGYFQSEKNVQFTKLNIRRLQRIYKTTKLEPSMKQILKNISHNQIWLTLSEGWCGDAAQSLPIIAKMTEENDKIRLLITSRDEHMNIMNNFLTDGNKAIPIVIFMNEDLSVINSWGPRPAEAHKLTMMYKNNSESLNEEYQIKLQLWYKSDKGKTIQNEFKQLLKS